MSLYSHFPKMHLSNHLTCAVWSFDFIHAVLCTGSMMAPQFFLLHVAWASVSVAIVGFFPLWKRSIVFKNVCPCSPKKKGTKAPRAIQRKPFWCRCIAWANVCVFNSDYVQSSANALLFSSLLYSSLFNSRQTQGALNESDDPETGCLSDNKPTSRHFYPVALLLVSSHLLVVWLILSLALLLAKYQ